MELNITRLTDDDEVDLMDFSASVSELGSDAGTMTWRNACEYVKDHPLLANAEERAEARDYIMSFGAWDDDEINDWNDNELNAIVLQFIAGDIREMKNYDAQGRLSEYEENIGGNIYKSGCDWFYCIGN